MSALEDGAGLAEDGAGAGLTVELVTGFGAGDGAGLAEDGAGAGLAVVGAGAGLVVL